VKVFVDPSPVIVVGEVGQVLAGRVNPALLV
jgi:hypothetical protein